MSNHTLKLLSISIILSMLTACSGGNTAQAPINEMPMVKTEKVAMYDISGVREYPGRVIANQRVDLAFQVSGKIQKYHVTEGQKVKEGDLLVMLDPQNYQFDYEDAKARFVKAERDLGRFAQLLKTGTISEIMYDDKKEAFDIAQANYKNAEKNLNDTRILAPFSGVIAKTYAENFQEVQAKQRVLSLQDINTVDILIDVPERDLALMTKDQLERRKLLRHRVIFDTLSKKKFDVTVKEFATEADPITQSYKVTLTMPAPEDLLVLPGMNATMIVDLSKENFKEIQVPVQAVWIDDQGKANVWKLDQQANTVGKTAVKLGEVTGNHIVIVSGLDPGDEIVVAGVSHLTEGARVRLFSVLMNQE